MASSLQPEFLLVGFEDAYAWQHLLSALEAVGLSVVRCQTLDDLRSLLRDRAKVVLLVRVRAGVDIVSGVADALDEVYRACPCILVADFAHYGVYHEFDSLNVCFLFDSTESPEVIVLAARWLAQTKAC